MPWLVERSDATTRIIIAVRVEWRRPDKNPLGVPRFQVNRQNIGLLKAAFVAKAVKLLWKSLTKRIMAVLLNLLRPALGAAELCSVRALPNPM